MKRRLRERAQPASPAARKRKSRSAEVEACIEEEALISDLDELLRNEEGAAWWTGDGKLPSDDSPLVDLLQQLAACDEGETCQDFTEAASALPKMAAYPSNMAAAPRQRGSVNRNAQAARLNRLRKKEYVSGLEGKVARLSEDNQRLERERRGLEERVHRLEEESRYLKAVLANDSALSQLLGRLTGLGGVKLSTSLFSEREEKPREHDYALLPPVVEETEPPSGGGVCLHVEQDKVSVEFCPACSRSAASTAKM